MTVHPAHSLWSGLHDLILNYQPHDPVETLALSEILRALDVGPSKLFKSSLESHFTVSALCLDAQMKHALMIHHKKLGRLLQPGGHVEVGDACVQSAALREVCEETLPHGAPPPSLMLAGALLDVDAHHIPATATVQAHRHLDLRFLMRMPDSYEPWHDPIESTGVCWVPLAELACHPDASLARMTHKAIEMVRTRPFRPGP